MTFPTVEPISLDDAEAIKQELGLIIQDIQQNEERPRRRGRPKKEKIEEVEEQPKEFQVPTLPSPPLTARDQKEIAKRFKGILIGATGVASVIKPYLQMTEDEAEAIATPLTTYLIRREPTSKIARQVLDEYDLAAFVLALAAYLVRIYHDYREERNQKVEKRKSFEEMRADSEQFSVQTQVGEERPVNRINASFSEVGWTPSSI